MTWEKLFLMEMDKQYYKNLMEFVNKEYEEHTIFPPKEMIFKAFDSTPLKKVKVVILGQDPYHDENQAHGLSFSVNRDVKIPPSLSNIYKELEDDFKIEKPDHGYLQEWANEGVLLLNTVLTVRAHEANSHKNKGWEIFTDEMIRAVNNKKEAVVFILWGAAAQKKRKMIDEEKHLVIASPHPSPLSCYRGFYGSKPFSKSNEFLRENGLNEVNWQKILK